jgi:hypothetical protein
MKKKIVTIVLILVILLITTGLTYSDGGPKTYNFGPIVIVAHPWGENPHSANPPNCSRSSSGGDFPDLTTTPTLTSFALKFYLNYVVKKTIEGQSSIQQHPSGE